MRQVKFKPCTLRVEDHHMTFGKENGIDYFTTGVWSSERICAKVMGTYCSLARC